MLKGLYVGNKMFLFTFQTGFETSKASCFFLSLLESCHRNIDFSWVEAYSVFDNRDSDHRFHTFIRSFSFFSFSCFQFSKNETFECCKNAKNGQNSFAVNVCSKTWIILWAFLWVEHFCLVTILGDFPFVVKPSSSPHDWIHKYLSMILFPLTCKSVKTFSPNLSYLWFLMKEVVFCRISSGFENCCSWRLLARLIAWDANWNE